LSLEDPKQDRSIPAAQTLYCPAMFFTRALFLSLAITGSLSQTIAPPDEQPPANETVQPPAVEPSDTATYMPPSSDVVTDPSLVSSIESVPIETPTATDGITSDPIVTPVTSEETVTATDGSESTTAADVSSTPDATPTDNGSATTATTPTATSTVEPVVVDLSTATVGENAVIGEVDGEPAVFLSPPAWGQASFSVAAEVPAGISEGDNIQISATVSIQAVSSALAKRWQYARQDSSSCQLTMSVDGQIAYDEPISGTGASSMTIVSKSVTASSNPKVEVVQTCKEKPITVSVHDVKVEGEGSTAGGDGGGGGGGGGGDNPSGSTETNNDSSGSDDSVGSPTSTESSGGGNDSAASSITTGLREWVLSVMLMIGLAMV
jgi:hypothetical protein